MATTRKWKDRDGNPQEQTEWHQLVFFGRQAEVAGQYLEKGSRIHVEGRLQTSSWEDRNSGERKYKTEIIVENFQMLGGGSRSSDTQSEAQSTVADDDDILF